MRRAVLVLWLVPIVLAAVFWFWPPRGDDSYHHTINAVEQARAWKEGALLPRYHRGWNGGTGTFVPTIYSPIPLTLQGGLARLVGDGQRAVGLSLAAALLVMALALVKRRGGSNATVVLIAPYIMAVIFSRSTTTEAWSLAGAAIVLPLALPPVRMARWWGFGLAMGVLLVAGCQVGMLVQLGWLLGAAWTVSVLKSLKDAGEEKTRALRGLAGVFCWGFAGLCAAAIFWLPAILDAHHLAIRELVSGPLDWRNNFLPDGSDLGLLLTAVASSQAVIALIVIMRGEGANRLALAVAIVIGVVLSTPLSAPLWHLPKMETLQFPWRTLGPATLVAVLAIDSLRGRWRTVGIVVLLLPLALVPVRVGTSDDSVPTASSPEELALIAQRQWGLVPTLPTTAGLYAPGFHRLESLQRLARQQPRIENVKRDASGGTFRVTSEAPGRVLLPLQWWPEWRIEVDGSELPYTNQWGLVAIELEAETVKVCAKLAASHSRNIGALLSAVGLVMLLFLLVSWRDDHGVAPSTPGAA